MTTKKDNRKVRDKSELWHVSLEFTQGVPQNNAEDPSGQYPNKGYFFGSSIHRASRGAEILDLWSRGSYSNIDLAYTVPKPSVYPHNQVHETEYGHVISFDDTPGAERILIKHGSGSGVDMRADGTVIVSSKRNRVEIVGGSNTVVVDGDAHLAYKGNLSMDVHGDYAMTVRGDRKTTILGNDVTEIRGADRKRVEKTYDRTILENSQVKVIGEDTRATMGARTDIVNGEFALILDDNAEIRSSSDIRVSSETIINLAAPYISAVSENLALMGTKGVMGGDEMEYFGKTYTGPSSGKGDQTTFYGTLVGLAHEARSSHYAVYSKYAWSSLGARYAIQSQTVSNIPEGMQAAGAASGVFSYEPKYKFIFDYHQNNPGDRMPTEPLIRSILENTEDGIMQVRVLSREISDRITFDDEYQTYFRSTPTMEEIRAMMRYEEVRNGAVATALAVRGLISTNYNTELPKTVSQIATSDASTRFGQTPLGNPIENTTKRFKVRPR